MNHLGKFIKKHDFISKNFVRNEIISVIGYGPLLIFYMYEKTSL